MTNHSEYFSGSLMNIEDRSAFKDSDIDLFFYGLTEEEANEKLKNIYFVVQSNTKVKLTHIRIGLSLEFK
jgi:hypothetical protein